MRETMHVENRMIRLGQFVEGEHTENRSERRSENGQLKGDGNKSRPAIEGTAPDVQRVGARHSPVLKEESSDAPRQATEKCDRRHQIALQAKSFRKTFDREGSKGIEAAVARLADFLYSVEEFFRRAELAYHTIYVGTVLHHFFSSDVSATSSRISAMEIAGRTRTKRKRSVTNMPMVPIKVAQSQNVGL